MDNSVYPIETYRREVPFQVWVLRLLNRIAIALMAVSILTFVIDIHQRAVNPLVV